MSEKKKKYHNNIIPDYTKRALISCLFANLLINHHTLAIIALYLSACSLHIHAPALSKHTPYQGFIRQLIHTNLLQGQGQGFSSQCSRHVQVVIVIITYYYSTVK